MRSSLILGGQGGDIYYELGLLQGLVNNGLEVEVVGNNAMGNFEIVRHPQVTFLNFREDQDPSASLVRKFLRIMRFYRRLIWYAMTTKSRIFHIQWLNKFLFFDRIVLNLFYKACGKKLVFTAHNVDQRERDKGNSLYNRLTLKAMYHIYDHIIVHTPKMRDQVIQWFGIHPDKVSVVPYGINDMVPRTGLGQTEARNILGLPQDARVLLFFGFIAPYKGLDILISSMPAVRDSVGDVRLVVAGNIKNRAASPYWQKIERIIEENDLDRSLKLDIRFIEDEDIEPYFTAADVLVLPYRYIFQSGILFLSLNYGLPVIATDVGSLKDFVETGKTGFVCEPEDPEALSACIVDYFASDIYKNLPQNKKLIYNYAKEKYSWDKIAKITSEIYADG
ncbi:MAG: glycosyltransferase family 4 protein [Pseudomonadota bacterium]|jgi:glycosyltransferase involved in cell wall biosynthesis